MKDYRFLLFDADSTLLNFDLDMTNAFERLYHHFEYDKITPYTPQQLALYEECNSRWWHRFEQKLCTKPELFYTRFKEYLEQTGFPGDPNELNEVYFAALSEGGAVYPGAVELIEKLSHRHRIYIITNGNADTQPKRLARSGLMPYVSGVFVSEAVGDGVGKPDRRYFDHVAENIPGFEREKAIVIGDSQYSDIQGAINAGLDSIWYTGVIGEQEQKFTPTYVAKTYEEILKILERE